MDDINTLLNLDTHQVDDWIHRVWEGTQQVPANINWLGLAEGAALYARRDKQGVPRPDLDWARVAIMLYQFLIKQTPNSYRRASLECSMMRLRIYFIRRLGVISNHPILAVSDIEEWFFANLKLSRDEAIQKSAYYKSLSVEEALASREVGNKERLEMRMLKEKLSVLEFLKDIVPLHEELLLWLSIRKQLL